MFNLTKEKARQLWCEALRSGAYAQDIGQLKTDKGYCCLGVACDLYRLHENDGIWDDNYFVSKNNEAQDSILPLMVQKWLGLKSCDGSFFPDDSLVESNDDGMNFQDIANIIENDSSLWSENDT